MAEEEGTSSNVIHLRPETFKLIRGNVPSEQSCGHRETVCVDGHSRVVYCSRCNAHLDPMMVLVDIANDASWVLYMRKEKQSLAEHIEALKQERNALLQSTRGLKKRRGLPP